MLLLMTRFYSAYLLFLLIPLLGVAKVSAQDTTDYENSWATAKLNNDREEKRNWIVPAISAMGYASLTYLCYRKFDDDIQRFFQRNQTNFTSAVANGITDIGLGKVQSIGLAGSAIYAFAFHKEKMKQTVIIWAGSLLMNSIITDQLKKTFQRHRPNTGDPYNSFDWRHGPRTNSSLPSAHTSNAFTTAIVFATMYKDEAWVPPVAYSLAALVGLSRVYKNVHWASDVLTGAAVGFLSAKAMFALYKIARKKLSFLPRAGWKNCSLTVLYDF